MPLNQDWSPWLLVSSSYMYNRLKTVKFWRFVRSGPFSQINAHIDSICIHTRSYGIDVNISLVSGFRFPVNTLSQLFELAPTQGIFQHTLVNVGHPVYRFSVWGTGWEQHSASPCAVPASRPIPKCNKFCSAWDWQYISCDFLCSSF